MTFNELQEKYNSHKAVCVVCGKSLETSQEAGPLGQYFVMDKDGNFYCTDCDIDFEDGDDRIFDPYEECLDDCTLEEILEKLSGILDQAYEFAGDSDEKSYICKVEDALWHNLREAGLIK
jgi:hypothetical protein